MDLLCAMSHTWPLMALLGAQGWQSQTTGYQNQRSFAAPECGINHQVFLLIALDILWSSYLEAEGLFPPVTIFLDLFLHAGYFFNAFD